MRITLRSVEGQWEMTLPELGNVPIRVSSLADVAPAVESLVAHLGPTESVTEWLAA